MASAHWRGRPRGAQAQLPAGIARHGVRLHSAPQRDSPKKLRFGAGLPWHPRACVEPSNYRVHFLLPCAVAWSRRKPRTPTSRNRAPSGDLLRLKLTLQHRVHLLLPGRLRGKRRKIANSNLLNLQILRDAIVVGRDLRNWCRSLDW